MNVIKRPILKIPLSILEKVLEICSLAGMLAIFLNLFMVWGSVPNKIPTHFGPSGQADAWGGKGSLLFLPILVIAMYTLLTVIGRFPHIYNYLCEITENNARFQYQNARTMMVWLKTEIIFIFGYIEWKTVQVALGKTSGLGIGFLPVFLIVVFGTIGVYTYRMVRHK